MVIELEVEVVQQSATRLTTCCISCASIKLSFIGLSDRLLFLGKPAPI